MSWETGRSSLSSAAAPRADGQPPSELCPAAPADPAPPPCHTLDHDMVGHGLDMVEGGRGSHGEVAGPEGEPFGWPVPCEVKSSHQQKWAELSVGFLVRPYLRQNRGLRMTVCAVGQCAEVELAVWWVWLVVE